MGVRPHFKSPHDVVELRETPASPIISPSAFRTSESSNVPVPAVAPLVEPDVFSSKEHVRHQAENMRSHDIEAVGHNLPHPITISEAAEIHPGSTPPSETGTATRSSIAHENDVTPISRLSSFLGESDNSRPTTPIFRQRSSLYPAGDFRNSSTPDINDMRSEIMCNYLHQQQLKRMWSNGSLDEGVVLKKSREEYTCCPSDLHLQAKGLCDAVKGLNVRCAMTVNTRVVQLFLRREDRAYVPLENGLRLQILPDVSFLPQCQKHHFAAFIQDSAVLLVWDDQPTNILNRIKDIESQLMNLIWNSTDENGVLNPGASGDSEKQSTVPVRGVKSGTAENDYEVSEGPRRIVFVQSILTAITIILITAAIGSGVRRMMIEVKVDHNYLRLALLIVAPLQVWLALFFMQSLATGLAQIVGPISQMNTNTKFYSGIAPSPLRDAVLPHVTIQCPVYKEGLWAVIDPTVKSVKAAISTYEMQGGSANMFVNDDGMQLLSAEEAQERSEYYEEHNIGWVARPKHSPKPTAGEEGFVRAGKFKKASNMNYALSVSTRVEDQLAVVYRHQGWTKAKELEAYDAALAGVIQSDNGRTWAEGNVRVGDYILIIDSDTRVPTDCFMDAVSEMETSPQVAIIQYASAVMNVTDSWFEKAITFFTDFVYTSIRFAVANGDVAPFVGHNAFLRWSAIQDVAFTARDGTEKFWSEETVSEDFDLALRLQTSGYILRLASYAGQGFKEGVSLTVYDELARWEKYAYGCGELVFNPLAQWILRGPFTPLFRRFVCSSMPIHSKITIMAYIGTYYAIGSTWILTLLNYCLVGWFNGYLDNYYVDSFKIYFSIVMVFAVLGNFALAILRYRTEERSLLGALYENFKWLLVLTTFLGGISVHVSQAILCHLFGVDMTWGATSKEATDTSFFQEVPTIIKKFKTTFVWCIAMVAMMVVLAGVGPVGQLVPYDWQITDFVTIWPLANIVSCHFLLPLVLNPGLMQFTF